MGYDAGVALIWGVRVSPELSVKVLWRLFGDQIRELARQHNISMETAFDEFMDMGEFTIPGTEYTYETTMNYDELTGIFIALNSTSHWVIRSPDETESHREPTPQEVQTFLGVLAGYGIGDRVEDKRNLRVSEYALWTAVIGG